MLETFALSRFNLICILTLWALAIAGLVLVPFDALTPIHWNLMGVPDGFAPGWMSVLLPAIIGTLILGFLAFISRTVARQNLESGRAGVDRTITALLLLLCVVEMVIILSALGQVVPVPKIAAFTIGALLVAVGDILPKSRPNSLVGIRLSHTLVDVDVWRKTHKWAGRMLVVSGVMLVLFSLFVQQPTYLLFAILLAVFLPLAVGVAISYRVAHTQKT